MRNRTVLDSRLFIRLDAGRPTVANSLFAADPKTRAHLANQLLLYDELLIPTHDFGIVPILINWFGVDVFQNAVEVGSIGFARRKGLLAYVGNGNAISMVELRASEENPFKWWDEALYGDTETAIYLQLLHNCPFLSSIQRTRLAELTLGRTQTIRYENNSFIENVAHESYRDIQASPVLSAFVVAHETLEHGEVDLERLPSVGPGEARVLGIEGVKTSVDLVLRVAEINFELIMATLAGNVDLTTSWGAEEVLSGKFRRAGIQPTAVSNFVCLLALNDLPDIGIAVASGKIRFSEIWALRSKRTSIEFRDWFRSVDSQESATLLKEYVKSLRSTPFLESLPSRIVRFAVTTAVGALSPAVGFAVSAVDSFFLDHWTRGFSPRVFLDELLKLPFHTQPLNRKDLDDS